MTVMLQAAFVNNPLLGIFFLAAFFLLDWQVGEDFYIEQKWNRNFKW
jgi:hypothetical protein